ELFVAPFTGLLSFWSSGAMILEVTTLVAMGIYALVFWGGVRVLVGWSRNTAMNCLAASGGYGSVGYHLVAGEQPCAAESRNHSC
ncbi:MAG: hypothetical protein ACRD4B_03225, partial [Acidobacteriota bacterium]